MCCAMKGYSYVAPSVLFTDNAISRDIENNNASVETMMTTRDFSLHIAAQFKVTTTVSFFVFVAHKSVMLTSEWPC